MALNRYTTRLNTLLGTIRRSSDNVPAPAPAVVAAPSGARGAVTTATGSFLPEPARSGAGLLLVLVTSVSGLLMGAAVSHSMASFLEENDLFVPSDDDDDDL